MKIIISIFVLLLFGVNFTVYAQEYNFDYVWVSIDDRYRLISINIVDDPLICDGAYACTTTSSIILLRGYEFYPATLGCNAWSHEVLHFWGYSHEDMESQFRCD